MFASGPSDRPRSLRTHVPRERPNPSLRSARSVLYAWPARSCCSRTTTRSTGRSARTSPATPCIPTERRCAEGCARRRPGQIPAPAQPCLICGRVGARRGAGCRASSAARHEPRRSARARPQPIIDDGPPEGGPRVEKTGGVLLSQALAGQVPSALRGLTALFGMGRGVSPSPRPPEKGERPRLPRSLKTAHATAGITK